MYIRGKKTTIIAAITALGIWAGSIPLAAADTAGAAPYAPKGILAVWAQGRGPAHLAMLRNEYLSISKERVSTTEPYLPKGILAVWAQGRGQAHFDMLRHEYEGLSQTRSASSEPWQPKGILAVWAQGRGQAHFDMLKREYESVNKDLVTDTEGHGDAGNI